MVYRQQNSMPGYGFPELISGGGVGVGTCAFIDADAIIPIKSTAPNLAAMLHLREKFPVNFSAVHNIIF